MEIPKNVSLDFRPYTTYLDHTLFVPFFQEAQKGYVGPCHTAVVETTRPTVLEFESCSAQQPTVEKSKGVPNAAASSGKSGRRTQPAATAKLNPPTEN